MKDNRAYRIKKVLNGFTVEDSWMEKFDDGTQYSYKSETTICNDWAAVVKFIEDNQL